MTLCHERHVSKKKGIGYRADRDCLAQQRDHFFPIAGLCGKNGDVAKQYRIVKRPPTLGHLNQRQGAPVLGFGFGKLSRLRGDNGGSFQLCSMNFRMEA